MSLDDASFYIHSCYLNQFSNTHNESSSDSDQDSVKPDDVTATENVNNERLSIPLIMDNLPDEQPSQPQRETLQFEDSLDVVQERVGRPSRYTNLSLDFSALSELSSGMAIEFEDLAAQTMKLFLRNDPSLHQDILNYVGSRPAEEKIFMSDMSLLPKKSLQCIIIASFWLVSCGICCMFCSIVGMTTTSYSITEPLKLLKQTDLKLSWINIWTCGAVLIVLNFVMLNGALWLVVLWSSIATKWRNRKLARRMMPHKID